MRVMADLLEDADLEIHDPAGLGAVDRGQGAGERVVEPALAGGEEDVERPVRAAHHLEGAAVAAGGAGLLEELTGIAVGEHEQGAADVRAALVDGEDLDVT